MVHSFSQPLSHVFVRELDFNVCRTRVGELISVVGIAKVSPYSSEIRRDVVVSVFLRNHLRTTVNINAVIGARFEDEWANVKKTNYKEQATLTTWSLGRRLQSASVSSSPSMYLRVDSPWLLWCPDRNSSGSGVIKYTSNLARALFRLFSNAETHSVFFFKRSVIIVIEHNSSIWLQSWCSLTSIFFWSCVFDISRELGEYVISCQVGFTILYCKFGIPEGQEIIGQAHAIFYSHFPMYVCLCVRSTLVEPACPPGTPLFYWHQWERCPGRWGTADGFPGPDCEDQLVFWQHVMSHV